MLHSLPTSTIKLMYPKQEKVYCVKFLILSKENLAANEMVGRKFVNTNYFMSFPAHQLVTYDYMQDTMNNNFQLVKIKTIKFLLH